MANNLVTIEINIDDNISKFTKSEPDKRTQF